MKESCRKVLEHLGTELEPELADHARGCEDCQSVLIAYRAMPDVPPAPLSASASSAIRARALSELSSHPRSRPWWSQALMLSTVNLLLTLAGVIALGGHGLVMNAVAPLAVAGVGVLLGAVILMAPFAAVDPGRRWTRISILLLIPVLAAAITFGGSGSASSVGFLRGGLGCAAVEVALWIIPALVAVWTLTQSAFRPQRAAVAAMGSSAIGLLVLDLHCSVGAPEHLFVFHVLPSLLLVALVMAIRSRIPSRSFAP